MIACPVCDAGPWPDTYGADGGQLLEAAEPEDWP